MRREAGPRLQTSCPDGFQAVSGIQQARKALAGNGRRRQLTGVRAPGSSGSAAMHQLSPLLTGA
jgi:hypothetical protein